MPFKWFRSHASQTQSVFQAQGEAASSRSQLVVAALFGRTAKVGSGIMPFTSKLPCLGSKPEKPRDLVPYGTWTFQTAL